MDCSAIPQTRLFSKSGCLSQARPEPSRLSILSVPRHKADGLIICLCPLKSAPWGGASPNPLSGPKGCQTLFCSKKKAKAKCAQRSGRCRAEPPLTQSPAISERICLGTRRLEALEEGRYCQPTLPPQELGRCWGQPRGWKRAGARC